MSDACAVSAELVTQSQEYLPTSLVKIKAWIDSMMLEERLIMCSNIVRILLVMKQYIQVNVRATK